MGKKHGKKAAAKRGAKKREKELKRKARKASGRIARPAPVDDPLRQAKRAVAAWRPATEGIEGLADALGVSWQTAALIAEDEREHHGRADVTVAALPSTLHQETTEALVAALAARGVVTDEATFRELAASHDSAEALVGDTWLGTLHDHLTVSDRDLLRGAAIVLWSRWAEDLVSNEELETLVTQADMDLDDPESTPSLAAVAGVWERVRDVGGGERLARAGLDARYAYVVINAAHLLDTADPERLQAMRTLLAEVRASYSPELGIDLDFADAVNDLDWRLGEADAVIDRLLLEGESDPARLLDAAVTLLDHDHTVAQLDRLYPALLAAELVPDLRRDQQEALHALQSARNAAALAQALAAPVEPAG